MKYFTVSEMLYSPTAVKRGIWNGCDREKEDNLEALVDNVLDPVRTRYGKAVHVSSGYRCEQLNKLIHGALGSQHLRGEAATSIRILYWMSAPSHAPITTISPNCSMTRHSMTSLTFSSPCRRMWR